MSTRLTKGVTRPAPVMILVNGLQVPAHEGESLATALIAAGKLVMSRDSSGRARAPYCNMGVCFDCLVTVVDSAGIATRVRACLTTVRPGMQLMVADQ